MSKNTYDGYYYTQNEWDRSVGWGTLPPERDIRNRPQSTNATAGIRDSLEQMSRHIDRIGGNGQPETNRNSAHDK